MKNKRIKNMGRIGFLSCLIPLAAVQISRADDKGVTCVACHSRQAGQLSRSVHTSLHCQECHGGETAYHLTSQRLKELSSNNSAGGSPRRQTRLKSKFDHGPTFTGKPPRAKIPEMCGKCHADVERMNPFGLRTDQLARYWTSVHGKTLTQKSDDRVAVCTDCHGVHDVMTSRNTASKTHPLNVPDTCGKCHADKTLMDQFGLPVEVVSEYRHSVHGRLLLEQHDTGAPNCATCHGNHAAAPPGFKSIGDVCGKCHVQNETFFAKTVHATLPGFKGCVQCHGGGADKHYHFIQRLTLPAGQMVNRYARLLKSVPNPSLHQISNAIHPGAGPRKIIENTLTSCTECHDDVDDDENLPKLFTMLDEIAQAEQRYVQTGLRLDRVGRGILLVEDQRFKFEDAKTSLIALAPLQHTMNNDLVKKKIVEVSQACDSVNADLDRLERGLHWRHQALIPIWIFALLFSMALYAKYHRLKAIYVKPLPREEGDK